MKIPYAVTAALLSLVGSGAHAAESTNIASTTECGCLQKSIAPTTSLKVGSVFHSGEVVLMVEKKLLKRWSDVKFSNPTEASDQHRVDMAACTESAKYWCR